MHPNNTIEGPFSQLKRIEAGGIVDVLSQPDRIIYSKPILSSVKNSIIMNKSNPWNRIPLEDYEQHMQHENVAQAQLLNHLTIKYLQKHSPECPLFLGISGGNGLEHIDISKTKIVYGIDVNQSYL